jgi:hypothetical protein
VDLVEDATSTYAIDDPRYIGYIQQIPQDMDLDLADTAYAQK